MAQNARADFKIRIEDPTNPSNPPLTITDNGPGDTNALVGQISFNVQYGNFLVAAETGISKPIVGGPSRAEVDLNSLNITSFGGGQLLITLEDTDFTVPPNALLTMQSSVGGTMTAEAGSSVTFTAYANPGNAVPFVLNTDVTNIPAGSVALPLGTFTTDNYNNTATTTFTRTPGSPYSLFSQARIVAVGDFSSIGFDHSTFVTAPPCTGAIGDFVWNDLNKNGLQDSGEPGFAGVTVQLFQNGGNSPISTTVTTSGGFYQFTGLCAGSYTVVIPTTPAGYSPTTSQVGNDRTIDSNSSPAPVTLPTDNFTDETIDFGYFLTTPPSANCATIVAVQGVSITPVTMVGSGGTGGPYTFTATGLPAGLTMSTSGTISGTPTVSGTFSYTVTVTDSGGNTGIVNCSVTVNAPQTANCVAITAVQGVAITPVTMVGSGGTGGPYTFTATGLPAGLTMSSSGTISGTPTVSGIFSYTVTVTDSGGNTGTVNCSVTVNAPPTANCVSITAVQGVAITPVTMVGSGGTGGPYTFTATGLPAGLTMSSSGTISGTPTVSGTFSYTVTVKDSAGNTGTVNCSVTVHPGVSANCVSITAVQGVAITPVTMVGTGGVGGPYTFTATGLPAGLTMSSTGTISGTPTVSGTFSYTVTVKDAAGNTGTVNCSVTVMPPPPPPLTLNCVSPPAGQVGSGYSFSVSVSGGVAPYTFSIVGGSLPPGLTLDTSTGVISGTPSSEGTFNFTVKVVDSVGNVAISSCGSVTIKTCGSALTPITYNVNENNTISEIAWFNSHLGKLGGTIPASTFQIFITGGKITFGPSILSVPDAVITFSSTATCAKTVFNTAFNRWETTIPLSNASTADEIFAAGLAYQIPVGFPQNVNNVTWSADITSTAPGLKVTWQFGVSNWLTSNNGSSFPVLNSSPFVPDYNGMMVNPGHNVTTCGNFGGDHAGSPEFSGRQNVLTGGGSGGGGSNWTGSWSSTPGQVNVCQPSGPAALSLSCPAGSAPINTAYSSSFTATGGSPGYTFSITSGSLPPGLTLNTSTGALTGTPTTGGSFAFTGRVTDSAGGTAASSCTITVGTTPLAAQCIAAPINTAVSPAASFAAIGLQGSQFQLSSGPLQVNGALGIGPSGLFHLSGGATLNSTLYTDPSATVQIDNGSSIGGGTLTQSMSALQAAALALSSSAAGLTPTQTFAQIISTITINGNGSQNVISVPGNFHLSGATLTLSGGASDTFIVNAPNGMQLDGGAKILLAGISPSQVLFNFPGNAGQVQTSGNANTAGIFLAPSKQMQINGGVHKSEFIAGGPLSFQSNPQVTAPMCVQ
jgi:hypothetical protein